MQQHFNKTINKATGKLKTAIKSTTTIILITTQCTKTCITILFKDYETMKTNKIKYPTASLVCKSLIKRTQ